MGSVDTSHRVSHQAVFLESLSFNCSISGESARTQKATSSLLSSAGATCSFCPSAETPRWTAGTLSAVTHATHTSYLPCARGDLGAGPSVPLPCRLQPTVQTGRHSAQPSLTEPLETAALELPWHSPAFHGQGSNTWATYIVSKPEVRAGARACFPSGLVIPMFSSRYDVLMSGRKEGWQGPRLQRGSCVPARALPSLSPLPRTCRGLPWAVGGLSSLHAIWEKRESARQK